MSIATAPSGPAPAPRSRERRAKRSHAKRARRASAGTLGRYTDPMGRPREVLARPAHAGSVLVIDRDARTLGDGRLVAHLGAEEPAGNAALVCRHYLQDRNGRWCRALAPEDLGAPDPITDLDLGWGPRSREAPASDAGRVSEQPSASIDSAGALLDRHGCEYRLGTVTSRLAIPALRWVRIFSEDASREPGPLSLRDLVGALESYEPARSQTVCALRTHRGSPLISVAVLQAELQRLDASRIVLNRGLRRAVLEAVQREGLSLSEIAIRCGRIKRDARGNLSGETSWLARRIGISPEGGEREPTPWIHSEVLALIARSGLGISPREVELG